MDREIGFDCLSLAMRSLQITNAVYIGFGSVWFSDFTMAHRLLGIRDMVSIERDEVVFKRAQFNRPYRTLEVMKGDSYSAIAHLLTQPSLACRPCIVWLHYD